MIPNVPAKNRPTAKQLSEALIRNGGSVTQTGIEFGVHRVTIYDWMRRYGIKRQPKFTKAA
jgi:transcriptional regulator of acetoin/glycerol metabolism